MFDHTKPPIFDGHNDVLTKFHMAPELDATKAFIEGCKGHIDLPRSKQGGFAGGFYAIYIPSPKGLDNLFDRMATDGYDVPLPAPIPQEHALRVAMQEAATLIRLEKAGALKICKSAADIEGAIAQGKMAAIFHMEGAEPIDENFDALEVLYEAGLRSLGPVWSRPTIFGNGVPFKYPGDPDTGPGLTELGQELVRICNSKKIMIDLSHLNEKGFWDVAKLSDAPLVATHSNCHAITPVPRNLTDKQLDAIKETSGMVGVNFAVSFLRPDGRQVEDTPLENILRHLDHLIEKLGEDHVGFGSDFDGAVVPGKIRDVAGLPALRKALRLHGYNEELMEKLCFRNWIGVLKKSWGN